MTRDLIYRNVSNCWDSLHFCAKDKSNQGLRQEDPLSHSLFIVVVEILSRKLRTARQIRGGSIPYWTFTRAMEINHLLYVDDVLIFMNGELNSFMKVQNFLLQKDQQLQESWVAPEIWFCVWYLPCSISCHPSLH